MSGAILPLRIEIDRRHWLARFLCRGDVEALLLGVDGRLAIERRCGGREEVVLEVATTISTPLVILRMRQDRRRETLVLPRCAMDAESHRRLRVWLRWRARAASFNDAA